MKKRQYHHSSSLQNSSPQEFLSSATKLDLKAKSSKRTLKSLIHSIPSSSPLSSSLLPSLHTFISDSIHSFRNPTHSPPSKKPRRSGRKSNKDGEDDFDLHKQQHSAEKLHLLAHVAFLCVSHPKKVFSPLDLLPSVQLLHDNLVFFESDSSLLLEISNLCELYWKENLQGREMLISQSLPFLVSRSLTLKKKVDVHRVYALREAFTLFDFEDESIEDLKMLLIRTVIAPIYLKTEDGRKFLGFIFGLSMQLMKEALAMIKSQIAFGRKSVLEAYGVILFRAWKGIDGVLKEEFEDGFLQSLIEGSIYANSKVLAASVRRVLGGFVSQRITDGVEKLLFRLAEPVIFRSLQVANSNVRLNALHLLLDFFPLEDPDAMKEVKDTLLDKQFFLMERLIMDDCPDVRVIAVEGCFRVLHLFWEIIPSSTITKLLTKLFDDMSHDICNEVRLSTVNGIMYLLGNPQSHEILKVLLPRVGHLILDSALSSRAAVMDLLLLIRDIRSFQFNKVVDLDVLLSTLANDHSQVAQKITRLLIPSYFPSKVSIEEACNRCVTLIKRSPMAGARFCEFAMLEGASPKSLMELVRVLISLVLSNEKLHADQIEGLLIAAASLCNHLASEPCYKNALKEFFTGGKVKCLFAVASNGHAQSSVLNICSAVSPDDVAGLVEECMSLVTNCRGLPKDVEMQTKVRSAHRLLLSCGAFDEMFDSLTGLLQKAAYHCHVKFGIEIPKQIVSPGKRKKCKSSVKISAKRKHVGGRNPTTFEDDYSIAVGIACQIKDLVVSEDFREAILGSQALELSFLALKVISEVSIEHCISCEYMDTSPVLAYSGLALHMSLQNTSISTNDYGGKKSKGTESSILETVMDQTVDHLLNCIDKLLREVNIGETQADTSISNDDGSISTKERSMSNKVKMLTAVLKLVVDSIAMGLLSCIHGRCLNFTSAYLKHIIFALEHQSSEKLQFKEDELKDIFLCLKSSFSYAAKLLNLILCDTSETSPLLQEAFDLVNDMLDLITSIELHVGSVFAAGLVASAKSWLPDLILALGYLCMLKDTQVASTYITALDCIKAGYPSWPIILAKTELHEIREANVEEVDDIFSKPEEEELCVFKKFMGTIVSLLKGKFKILDAIGVILLTGSVVGLERKDFGVALGLLHFVCVKLVGEEDREWNELDMMLDFLPDIYHQIERGIEEQSDQNARQKLCSARMLLDHVWFYHIHETGRFSAV
ncbi:hypothetical protein OIU77_003180 [Salix suchowensis]|uniref:ARM repeat superfamily protein n=1 Tax=Salix suchowensis TaxID=1278906 RepID=A0ABQ9B012_9ROSI|nr:hypothetical protein OIU77_003180 [Salix suchowensis]KAJ6366745.1 hypothetical protein OIU77_003180 [Salix suchowensis]KAJ6366746.1 hypothetical protein OIU77_003180 [Salix suchowensis]